MPIDRSQKRYLAHLTLALAVPTLAGLAYLIAFGAPAIFILTNAAALCIGLIWIVLGRLPAGVRGQRCLAIALLVFMALPLIIGPEISGVSRWIPLGGFALHTGAIAIPLLTCLAAADREYAMPILLSALFLALVQPDAAIAFAVMGASIGIYFTWQDWKPGLAAILAFGVGVIATLRGELPAQPFVERILVELAQIAPLAALALALSLLASFVLMLRAPPANQPAHYAMAGTLGGFTLAALLSNYPNVLIGYGASPIIGYALALNWCRNAEKSQK
jgi:cell division protein FtsW (lipid II flippase)